jgi:hypothetical protein
LVESLLELLLAPVVWRALLLLSICEVPLVDVLCRLPALCLRALCIEVSLDALVELAS